MKRVAVIGAGSCGLAAAKACKEGGIDVVIFERSGKIAGLWNYRDDDLDGQASVMKSTVINSSKEISAFSDFPPPKDYANYMRNRVMCRYLHSYAETFGLLEHIRYHQEVTRVVQFPDYDETGRWIVTAQNTCDKTTTEECYDGVMVCTGHHGYPHVPKFCRQEDFCGQIVHSHSLREPDAFKDKRVLIVGVGNSGLDAAVDISSVAKQVYLSTRRGTWISFRLGPSGLPLDTHLLTRGWNYLNNFFGPYLSSTFIENFYTETKFNHELYNLRPKHRLYAQHIAVNDHLPNKILSGTVVVKGDVDRFSEKGVVFRGEDKVTKVDVAILATGYKIKFPFLSDKIVSSTNNKVELYKLMFPPSLKHPTLAIIGLIQPLGPLFPIFEIQSRWYTQLLKGNCSLPDEKGMRAEICSRNRKMADRYVQTQRHTVQVEYVNYMDEIAAEIGAKPNLIELAFTDPILFYHCLFGPCTAYQYRLQGPNTWPNARRTILSTKSRILAPLNTRFGKTTGEYMSKYLVVFVLYFLFSICVLAVFITYRIFH